MLTVTQDTKFLVFGLAGTGIESEFTVSVADAPVHSTTDWYSGVQWLGDYRDLSSNITNFEISSPFCQKHISIC